MVSTGAPITTSEFEGRSPEGFDGRFQIKLERGGRDGPASGFTKAPERQGHPDPHSSLGDDPVHGLPQRVGNKPSDPVERTRELYELAIGNLESATSWSIRTLRMGTGLHSS